MSLQGLAVNDPTLIGIVSDGSPLPNAGIISDPNFQDWTGTFVAGHDGAGKAVDLGVDGNHLQLTPIGGGNFTLAGYFYLDSVDFASMERDSAPLFVDWSVMGRNFFVYVPTGGDHAGKLSFTSGAGTDEQSADLRGPQFPMDQWVHVIAKRVGDTIQLYLDGVLVAEESGVLTGGDTSYISDDVVNGPHEPYWNYWGSHYAPAEGGEAAYWYNKFGIGGHSYDWGRFPGKIDKVLIYDRALSADEVVELHNNNGEIQGENNMSYKFKISGPGVSMSDDWPSEQVLKVWSDDSKGTLLFEGALANDDSTQVPLEWTMTGINSITAGMYFQLEDQYDDGMLDPDGQAVQFAILDASDVEQFQATLAVGSDELDYLDLNDLGSDYLEMKVNASADGFEYVQVPSGGPVVVRTRIHHDQLRMPSHDEYEAELVGEFATPTLAVAGGAGLGSLQVQGLPLEYMGVDLDVDNYGLRGDGVGQMIVNKAKLDADITEIEDVIVALKSGSASTIMDLDIMFNTHETATGLEEDGTYLANPDLMFLSGAVSLKDADRLLNNAVKEEKERIDALLSGSSVDLDQLVELIAAYENADSDIVDTITTLQADVNQNEVDADASFVAATSDRALIRTEISDAKVVHDAEIVAAKVIADAALASEAARALAAEAGIQAALDTQEAKEAAYEVSNDAALASEVTRATAAEAVLQGNIDEVVGDLASYESANDAAVLVERLRIDDILSNVDPAALDSLTEIVTEMQSISGSLSDSIISVLGTHTSELSAHEAAYDAKMLLLDAEDADIRIDFAAGDEALNTERDQSRAAAKAIADAAMVAEQEARADGDTALSDTIVALKSGSTSTIMDLDLMFDHHQSEIGLSADGDYVPYEHCAYISLATTFSDADEKLDIALKGVSDDLVALTTGSTTIMSEVDTDISNIKDDLVSLDNQFQTVVFSTLGSDFLGGITVDVVDLGFDPMSSLIYVTVNGIILSVGPNADYLVSLDENDDIKGFDINVPLYEGDRIVALGVKSFVLASS